MNKVYEFEKRKYRVLEELNNILDGKDYDCLYNEIEDLLNSVIWELEEKEAEIEELNEYIDELRR